MLMAKVVTDLANRTPGKEAVAMESFAKALRMVRTDLFPLIKLMNDVKRFSDPVVVVFPPPASDHHR